MARGAILSLVNSKTCIRCARVGAPRGVPWIYSQTRCISISRNLPIKSVDAVKTPGTDASNPAVVPALHSHLLPDYQEWYIPVTRRTLITTLLDDDRFGGVSDDTRKNLKVIAAEVDAAVSNRYHQVPIGLKW